MATRSCICEICDRRDAIDAVALCKGCKQIYCFECFSVHQTFKATKKHHVVTFDTARCDICFERMNDDFPAVTLCLQCLEVYCIDCKYRHQRIRETKNHKLLDIPKARQKLVQKSKEKSNKRSTEGTTRESIVTFKDSEKLHQERKKALDDKKPLLPSQDRRTKLRQTQQPTKKLAVTDMDDIYVNVMNTFEARTKQDETDCSIQGIICFQDGRLILLDKSNSNLKMFSRDFNIIFTKSTKIRGRGMAKVSEQMIAVVGGQAIYFYSVTNDKIVLQDKRFNLFEDGYGVSYSRGTYAVACIAAGEEDIFIKFFSKDGDQTHRISSFNYKPHRAIKLDSLTDCLYVSGNNNMFTCLSLQGELQWGMNFFGKDVVEVYNCLLVSAFHENTLYLCSKDGELKKKLMKNDTYLDGIRYMAYNPGTQQIFLTLFQSNKIRVLHLCPGDLQLRVK